MEYPWNFHGILGDVIDDLPIKHGVRSYQIINGMLREYEC